MLDIAIHQIEIPDGVARRLRGEPETLLAALQRLDLLAQLVLPAPSSKHRVQRADQACDADRSIEDRHVAEQFRRAHRRRRVGPGARQKENREVRPIRLGIQRIEQAAQLAVRDRLFGDDQRGNAPRELGAKGLKVAVDLVGEAGVGENDLAQLRIRRRRREHQHAVLA